MLVRLLLSFSSSLYIYLQNKLRKKDEVISYMYIYVKDVDWRVSIEVNMLPLSWTAYRREESKSLRCRHHTYSMCAVSERSITLSSSFEIIEHDEELLSAWGFFSSWVEISIVREAKECYAQTIPCLSWLDQPAISDKSFFLFRARSLSSFFWGERSSQK